MEIMACPGGCLNGGGQFPPPPAYEPGFRLPSDRPIPATLGGTSAKELLDELDAAYVDGRVGAQGAQVVVGRRAIDNPELAGGGTASGSGRRRVGQSGGGVSNAGITTEARRRRRRPGTAAAAAQLKITSDW